jgi:addiction module RelE/StbE family toxin
MYELRINPVAKQDLFEIKEYITKELDNPTAAVNVVTNIIESYKKLKDYPMLGVELSSKINIETDYRYLISGDYIVFYKYDAVYVSIYRILYSRRDYVKVLFNEELHSNKEQCYLLKYKNLTRHSKSGCFFCAQKGFGGGIVYEL